LIIRAPQRIEIGSQPWIWRAQNRLHKRYMQLSMAGKDQRKVMTAIARELLGFIWAIAVKAERGSTQPIAA